MAVKTALEAAGIATSGAELVMEPVNTTVVTVEDAKKVLRLVDVLEEHDDIQSVYHTMELTPEIAAALDVARPLRPARAAAVRAALCACRSPALP